MRRVLAALLALVMRTKPWLLALAAALLALVLSGHGTLADTGFTGTATSGATNTTATVVSGQTYAALSTDVVVRLDTSNSADAGGLKAVLPAPYTGQVVTTCWIGWAESQVPPTVMASAADGGAVMQPYSGQAASGAGGMTTWTTITTPGACPSWKYDGTEWVTQ